MRPSKYYIKTFGCQMNEYDSERIAYLLETDGLRPVTQESLADIIIINTCAVREKADNKFLGYLGNLKRLKQSKKESLLICVCGCSIQKSQERLLKIFPYIDIAVGPRSISRLPDLLKEKIAGKNYMSDFHLESFDENILKNKNTLSFKAYIPIIVGCNNFCSYCIVPYVRGREISVPSNRIIERCAELADMGVVEITLLGQNVNSYGTDINEEISFASLLKKISDIRGIKRIRFMTSHPKDFTDELIEVISEKKNIANHIHLPLQAGSDKVLDLMNRGYDSKRYLEIVEKIRNEIPDCSITTDIIVGFPGETYTDFKKTLDVVKKASFHRAFTFIYSKRSGTKAAGFKDNIDIEEKKRWFDELLKLQNSISKNINSLFVGKEIEVLVEGISAKTPDMLEGRLENNTIINFKGSKKLIGRFVNVTVDRSSSFYLLGHL